jgi:chromate transporter
VSRESREARVSLTTIAREWGRIGCVGFGGPPAHISLLRELCVEHKGWIGAREFEDSIAATNLLPGPASTQLAILSAWRLRGVPGAVVGGVCFIVPGLTLILVLAAFFLSGDPPRWVRGAAAGAGAAVAAVALQAAMKLAPDSLRRTAGRADRGRWAGYAAAGGLAAVLLGPWLVLVLIAAGLVEVTVRALGATTAGTGGDRKTAAPTGGNGRLWLLLAAVPVTTAAASLTALSWVAFKVGALSYGGGFVIIPLMQSDAVDGYHWMTNGEFLNAVALGQVTPGPIVQTVAVVGYAAAGVGGGLAAAAVAFGPSFLLVALGARHFERLRAIPAVQAFFHGAGAAVIGAICGSAVPLALALEHGWQFGVLALAALWLLALRRGVISALLSAGALGVLAALAGWPVG